MIRGSAKRISGRRNGLLFRTSHQRYPGRVHLFDGGPRFCADLQSLQCAELFPGRAADDRCLYLPRTGFSASDWHHRCVCHHSYHHEHHGTSHRAPGVEADDGITGDECGDGNHWNWDHPPVDRTHGVGAHHSALSNGSGRCPDRFGCGTGKCGLYLQFSGKPDVYDLFCAFLQVLPNRPGDADTASSQVAARSVGVPLHRVFALAWVVAAVVADVGGESTCNSAWLTFEVGAYGGGVWEGAILGGLDSRVGTTITGVLTGVMAEPGGGYLRDLSGLSGLGPFLPFIV